MISHPSRLYMDDETGLSKNRIEALTDGMFAVVMTLLVLDISVPQIASSHYDIGSVAAETELLKRLFDLWPKILSFGISFITLAIYWLHQNGRSGHSQSPTGKNPLKDNTFFL